MLSTFHTRHTLLIITGKFCKLLDKANGQFVVALLIANDFCVANLCDTLESRNKIPKNSLVTQRCMGVCLVYVGIGEY